MRFFLFRLAAICSLLIPLTVLQAQPICGNCLPNPNPNITMTIEDFTSLTLCGDPELITISFSEETFKIGDIKVQLPYGLKLFEIVNDDDYWLVSSNNTENFFIVRATDNTHHDALQFRVIANWVVRHKRSPIPSLSLNILAA